ncbi:ArsA family ATPase [Kitasatospora sp. NBC_01287]|uniref:ArsA family ATPase n=1 Tax=Kitasatospora sp. NBC_01287 TaxID=2903573 RepID=UPI0022552F4C|nr:ArsA-related P-loop ATPase [Kitasatospora sp. NBC_01287]MCX4749563.1 ArsA family ATPase [Kitasatospora sp. NBC_01287]
MTRTVTRTVLVTGDAAAVPVVAAATALHGARQGLRTLLLAADDPHRLVDEALGLRLAAEARPVPLPAAAPGPLDGPGSAHSLDGPGLAHPPQCPDPAAAPGPAEGAAEGAAAPGSLHAARIDEQQAFRAAVAGLDGKLRRGFDLLGVEPLEPDELTALPGTRQLALLRALRVPADRYDLVVAAAPPPAELTAALALPEQLDRYLTRLLPEQRQAARALRPLLAAVAGVPMPADWLYSARAWVAGELAATRAVIESARTSVRLVLDADAGSVPGLRRAAAGLALFGHRVDAVVAHRALPAAALDSADPWLAGQAAAERARLGGIGLGVPLLTADRTAADPDAVAAQLYGGGPGPQPGASWPWTAEDRLAEDGVLLWRLAAPGAERADLELMRRGDELVVGLGPYRRILPLPGALRRCTVAGAALRDGELTLRFAPDPDLWPRSS